MIHFTFIISRINKDTSNEYCVKVSPIPISSVVAKPFIGPVPKINKINAVKPVVIFASKIEDNALLNPSDTDFLKPLPFLSSSRTRSNIKTLASTEIPIVVQYLQYQEVLKQLQVQLKYQKSEEYLITSYVGKNSRSTVIKYHP